MQNEDVKIKKLNKWSEFMIKTNRYPPQRTENLFSDSIDRYLFLF